jgi:hypothetical protein
MANVGKVATAPITAAIAIFAKSAFIFMVSPVFSVGWIIEVLESVFSASEV